MACQVVWLEMGRRGKRKKDGNGGRFVPSRLSDGVDVFVAAVSAAR